jgi:hypothetical protein
MKYPKHIKANATCSLSKVDTEMGQPECRIVMTRDKKKEKR